MRKATACWCAAPGDSLQLLLEHRAMIFTPGETLHAHLQPYALPIEPGTTVRLKVALVDVASGQELWTEKYDQQLPADDALLVPLSLRLPMTEGVYRLTAEASPRDIRARIGFGRVVARRELELLVLAAQPQSVPTVAAEGTAGTAGWTELVELDPANPAWWKRLTELPVPYLRRGPLDSGHVSTVSHALGRLTQLAPPPRGTDAAWAAYALPLEEPGKPHLLEIEYPGNVPQSVSVSIVEPNAAGQVVPVGIDSGFYVPDEAADRPAAWQKHRLIFWPRTKAPMALVVNRQPGAPAVYGKLRVLAGPERLPRASVPYDLVFGRPVWAYLEKPCFPKSFSAVEEADAESQRALDGWRTFYQGGTRLVEYLRHTGHTGAMLGVCGDGGTIYPSALLQPNTRYDSGAFFGNAHDPVQKDALEMLFRLFDRERLQLVPTLEFSAPLPGLEAVLRAGGPAAEGIAWIGPDGRSWLDHHAPRDGQAPYYNPLHPRVQEAMRHVVRELIDRYGHHPSLAGVAMRLSSDGYGVLPGPEWGLDDVTIEQFQRDTKIVLPAQGPQRHLERGTALDRAPPGGVARLAVGAAVRAVSYAAARPDHGTRRRQRGAAEALSRCGAAAGFALSRAQFAARVAAAERPGRRAHRARSRSGPGPRAARRGAAPAAADRAAAGGHAGHGGVGGRSRRGAGRRVRRHARVGRAVLSSAAGPPPGVVR